MSLLGSNDDEPKSSVVEIAPKHDTRSHTSRGTFLGTLVSQFQTSFGVPGGNDTATATNTAIGNGLGLGPGSATGPPTSSGASSTTTGPTDHYPQPHIDSMGIGNSGGTLLQKQSTDSRALSMSPAPLPKAVHGSTPSKPRPVNQHVKRFQTNFNFDPSPIPNKPMSKTSITSLINVDDEEASKKADQSFTKTTTTSSSAPGFTSTTPAPKKRKQANSKKDGGELKKLKTDSPATKSKQSLMSIKEMMNDTPTGGDSALLKLTPTLAAERDTLKYEDAELTKPTIVEVTDKTNKGVVAKDNKKKEPVEMPTIVLNVPLIDPKKPQPGRSEVVINVLKMAEDKYGWNALHPQAKNAFEYMEDLIDDDEDGSGDEDEEVEAAARKKEEENLTPEQLARRHQTKMNRKVGKYDYEDPFIDDEELQMEEEITSTKEGFFVYWGPLVDDRNATTKKGSSKSKK